MSAAVHHQRRVLPEDIVEDFLKILFGVPLRQKENNEAPQDEPAEKKSSELARKR